jgi:Mn-dependent DtxR family transcriptional regulator
MEMKSLNITTTDQVPNAKIKGKTLIIHKIRAKLGLTTALYCVLECISEFNKMYSEKPCCVNYISEHLGVPVKGVDLMIKELAEKGFLVFDKRIVTTDKWNKEFKIDIKQDFQEFWKLYNEGNKIKGEEAYVKARKLAEKDVLFDAAKAYLEKCAATGTFVMHTSSWLSPKFKYWEDDYTIPSDASSEKEKKVLTGKF